MHPNVDDKLPAYRPGRRCQPHVLTTAQYFLLTIDWTYEGDLTGYFWIVPLLRPSRQAFMAETMLLLFLGIRI
jgi:hypothetical protein